MAQTKEITIQLGTLDETGRQFLTDRSYDVVVTAYLVPGAEGLAVNLTTNRTGETLACKECAAMVDGCKGWPYWNITQLSTGRSVNRHTIGMFCEALEFAKLLAKTGFDWLRGMDTVEDDPKAAAVKELIYEYDDDIISMLAPCPQRVIDDYSSALALRKKGLLDDADLRELGYLPEVLR